MPTGVYERKRCESGCTCGKHTPYVRSAETRAKLSASKAGIATHAAGCTCGWCLHNRAERPGYSAVHMRLRQERGQPSLCEHCGTTTAARYDWAFTGPGHEWGGGQQFSDDLSEYIRLCRACHQKFDKGGD